MSGRIDLYFLHFLRFILTFLLEQMDKEEKCDLLTKQLVYIIVAVQAIFN